jgi:hypothetical protein
MKTRPTNAATPWTLHFNRDGTEDVAVIRDAVGDELVCSRHLWLPEGKDPVPPTLAAIWLMAAAPKLKQALDELLEQTVDMDLKHGIALSEGEEEARTRALAAIAEATCGKCSRSDPTNRDRAEWARNALAVFTAETFSGDHPDTMERGDLECAMGDLVADVLHLARCEGFNPEAILQHGRDHFQHEVLQDD